jgi:hypothetical protein
MIMLRISTKNLHKLRLKRDAKVKARPILASRVYSGESSLSLFVQDATKNEPLKKAGTPKEEDRAEADRLKVEGNELMRSENFEKAIEMYSK